MSYRKTTKTVGLQHLVLLLLCTVMALQTKAASILFNHVYQGAGTHYDVGTNKLDNIALIAGSGFRFTSVNPDAPGFVADAGGNDVRGILSYINPSGQVIQISGIISRLNKLNGSPEGFYFYDPITRKGYLLVLAGSESGYAAGNEVRTSSESALVNALNTALSDQLSEPRLAIANTSAVESAGFMVFTLTVSPAAQSGFSFSPTLVAGSASAGADYTATMEYNTGSGWQPVSGAISIAAGVSSFQIRVPLVDDNVVENNETFILRSGLITGGNLLNYLGTFGEATILDNDGTPAPITQGDVEYIYGDVPFSLNPSSPNTTGNYTYSIIGPGGVITQQQPGIFTILGVGVTQVIIYQAPGSGYGMGSKVITVTVRPTPLQIRANDQTKVYDGQPYSGGNGVSYTGLVYGETSAVLQGTLQYSGTSQQAVNVGSYTITPGGLSSANYTITYTSGQLHILKAPLTITASGVVKTYDGQPFSGGNGVSYSGFVNGETTSVLQGTLSYGGSAQGAQNAGSYTIVPAGYTATNYDITYVNGSLLINPAPLTIAALDQSKPYDGLVYGGGHSVRYSGFVGNDNATNALSGTLAFSGSWQGATAAGSYAIVPQGLSAANYTITYTNAQLSIQKVPLVVKVANCTKTYDGQPYSAGYILNYAGFVNNEGPSQLAGSAVFGGAAIGARAAGNYPITVSGLSAANYTIQYVDGLLTINKAALQVQVNSVVKTYDAQTYGGGNGVVYNGFVAGENASVLGGSLQYGGSAQGARNVGSYTLSAGGLMSDNYTISYSEGSLTIQPAVLTVSANSHTLVYNGLTHQGGHGVNYTGFAGGETEAVLGGSPVWGGSAQGARNAGQYTLVVSGLSATNYTLVYTTGTLYITPAPLTVRANDAAKTYDGLAYSGGNGVQYSGFVAGEDATVLPGTLVYSGAAQGATGVGSYAIIPGGFAPANYQVTYVAGNLTISPAVLTVRVVDKQKTYDGQVYSGGYEVALSGFVNGETGAGVVSGTAIYGGPALAALDVGNYNITASGLSAANYTIQNIDGLLTISRAPLTIAALAATKTYDGQPFTGGNGVTYTGFAPGENETVLGGTLVFSGTAQSATVVGSYSIVPGGLSAANYDIIYTNGSLTITPAALTITVNSFSKTYDGGSYSGGNGLSYAGFVGGENESVLNGTLVYGGTAQGAKDAGSYILTASGLSATNYTISYVAGALTISPAPLVVTAASQSKNYDGQVFGGTHSVRYAGLVGGETAAVLAGTLQYGGNWQGATGVGTYAIQPSGLHATNYTISYVAGTLTINPALLTIRVNDAEKTYDGQPYGGGYTLSFQGLVANETPQAALSGQARFGGAATSATQAGSHGIEASGLQAANYTIQYLPGTLTIHKASLVVTVVDATKTYDGQPWKGGNGVRYTGFAAGDDASVLGGRLQFGGPAQGARVVGSYALSAGGLSAANYTISYVAGNLSITPATLVVSLSPVEKTYDGQPWQGSSPLSFSGFVAGEGASVVQGRVQYGGPAIGARQAGVHPLSASELWAANYTLVYRPTTLTIHPAPLVIRVHDARKQYDGRPYNGTHGVSFSGFVGGETPAVLAGSLVYNGNWPGATNAGTYQIVPMGLSATNYTIQYVSGTLEISRAPLLVLADDKAKTYDGQPFDPAGYTVRYQGFVGGEDERQLSGGLRFGGTAATATHAGSYAILPGGLLAANYDIRFAAGTLTIRKAPLVITALPQSKTYDGLPFPASAHRVRYSGLVEGEVPAAVLQGAPRYGGDALRATDAGSYSILPSGLSAANYDIRYEEGLLTIRKATPVLVLPDVVKTYGDPDFRLSQPASKSTGRFSWALTRDSVALLSGTTVKIMGVGTAPITVWQAEDRNYNAASASARLIVQKAPLTVVANAAYRCVNDSNPTLSYIIKGFVKGENASVLSAQPQVSTTATVSSPAGLYPITVSGGAAANYSFRYVEGAFRVNKPQRQPVELPLVSVVKGQSGQLSARPFGTAYQWLPVTGLSTPNAANTEVRVQQDQEFTVRFTESTGCVVVDRVRVRVFEGEGLYVPNAFTPNGDGRNDLLRVIGPGLKLKFFRVFNRFGQMMFETTEAGRGWDGSFKGKPQPEDTYVWVLMAEKSDGSPLEGKGFVIITR